jgi:hypothetical protein
VIWTTIAHGRITAKPLRDLLSAVARAVAERSEAESIPPAGMSESDETLTTTHRALRIVLRLAELDRPPV